VLYKGGFLHKVLGAELCKMPTLDKNRQTL
jgi:hypothetical protein